MTFSHGREGTSSWDSKEGSYVVRHSGDAQAKLASKVIPGLPRSSSPDIGAYGPDLSAIG